MGLNLVYQNGQTPIDDDEKLGLRIPTITTREELDEFEQLNIEKAVEYYLLRRKFKMNDILTEKFILEVHQRMFKDVWEWAGTIRKTNKNIGVDKFQIGIQLKQLLDDCKYWIDHKIYNEEEIAIRCKHGLVAIHIFPNGNGRHSRLLGDIMMKHIFNKPIFSWGQNNLTQVSELRKVYMKALREADKGDFTTLIAFSKM